jgi:heme/copper-type cytochrome/quinol oxidase subunit 3
MEIPYVVTPRKDTGLFNSKIAIWLFLASEVMLFGGFFSAYVLARTTRGPSARCRCCPVSSTPSC